MCNGWLNEEQSSNIDSMLVTDEVFQVCNGWSNEVHPANIHDMVVTDEVSQSEMDSLNVVQHVKNNPAIFVISEVSHVPMGSHDLQSCFK